MAGRFERLILSHWQATELASRFQLDGSRAALEVVRMGGYPGAMALAGDPGRWRAYLRDSIVEPAIGRDLLATQPIRRPALLRQVFAIAVGHPAEVVALQKIRGLLSDAGSLETLAHYLDLLEEAFLVTAVRKYSGKVLRRRAAAPKLVTLNNALLASWADAPRPGRNVDPARFGRWVENACLAMAWNCGQDIHYWRDGPLEVDLVSRGSWGRWAVEIKTGRVATRDLSGALEFCRRYPEFRPALVCDAERVEIGARARVTAISWEEFLLDGLHLAD
jgi:predicted AAA+ superfamily ATPase